ncbi:hypothetical protein RSOL_224930, partial [Rhizoctonia solani AG-3 Rhs1AP]
MPLPEDVGRKLEQLRSLISRLPPKAPSTGSFYPFENFILDDDWTELTGSIQGSVNHTLEVAFGCRATADGSPLELKSHGPDLMAVVDVLCKHIDGSDGENPILIQWVSDLTRAVEKVLETAGAPLETDRLGRGKRARRNTEKQEILVQDNDEKVASKRKKIEEADQVQKAKARTEGNWPWDPEDLEDIVVGKKTLGRPSNALLDKLSIACKSKKKDVERWRCAALGYPDLVRQAALASANLSLGARLEALELEGTTGGQPSVKALIKQHELRIKNASKEVIAPVLRYRDLSDFLKQRETSPIVPIVPTREKAELQDTVECQRAPVPVPASSESDPTVTELSADMDRWEEEWELDDVIEKPRPGSRYAFEAEESDGVDLSAPILLDLLSDDPVEGVDIQPVQRGKPQEVVRGASEDILVGHFEF